MGSWEKLPAEILLQILHYLPNSRSTIQQCQLACRAWRDPAQKQLYKHVILITPETASLFIESMSIPGNYASKCVRSLSLGYSLCTSPSIEFIFPRLFDLCPNIIKLDTTGGQSSSFWAKLLLEHDKGNANHLREIPLTDLSCDDNINLYGYVAYKLREHLTSLTMCDWPSSDPSFTYDHLALHLQEFRHLKRMDIHLRGIKSIYQVFTFIQNCTSLESVNISITDIKRNLHYYSSEDDKDPNWYEIQSKLSKSNIKRLNVEYIPLTSKIIKYLVHLFPKLNELYFKSDNPNWEEDMDLLYRVQTEGQRISVDLWVEFLLHLVKHVPRFDVSNLFVADIPLVLANFIQLTSYGETMKLVYLERDAFFDFQPYIGIDSRSASKKYTRGQNFYDHRTIEVVFAAEEDHYDELPHLPVLEKVGADLKALEIQIDQGDRFADMGTDLYNMACGYFIDHTLKHCPLLDTLSLKNCSLLACDPNRCVNESITLLRMNRCRISSKFLRQIPSRLPNLTYLILHLPHFTRSGETEDKLNLRWVFNMPNLSLNTIRFNIPDYSLTDTIFLSFNIGSSIITHMVSIDNIALELRPSDPPLEEMILEDEELLIQISCTDIDTVICTMGMFDFVLHLKEKRPSFSLEKGSEYVNSRMELQ